MRLNQPIWWRPVAAALLLALVACGGDGGGGPSPSGESDVATGDAGGTPTDAADDVEPGPCVTDDDCDVGRVCDDGACVEPTDVGGDTDAGDAGDVDEDVLADSGSDASDASDVRDDTPPSDTSDASDVGDTADAEDVGAGDAFEPEYEWRPVPCEAGQCCVDGETRPPRTRCGDVLAIRTGEVEPVPPFDVQRRCNADGTGIERRYGYPGCDGFNPDCRADPGFFAYDEWELETTCSCAPGAVEDVRCLETPPWGFREAPREIEDCMEWVPEERAYRYRPAGSTCASGTEGLRMVGYFCEEVNGWSANRVAYGWWSEGVCTGSELGCTDEAVATTTGRFGYGDRVDAVGSCNARDRGQVCVPTDTGAECVRSELACGGASYACCIPGMDLPMAEGTFPPTCPGPRCPECRRYDLRCDGDTVQRRELFYGCDGVSEDCVRLGDPGPWLDVHECEGPWRCVDSPDEPDPAAWCEMQPNGCEGGPCCDPETWTWVPREGEICVERFRRTLPGGPFCAGPDAAYAERWDWQVCESGACRYRTENIVYDCPDGTFCQDRGDLEGMCVPDARGCDPDEPCCDRDGLVREADFMCAGPFETRTQCWINTDDEPVIAEFRQVAACNGVDATCDESPSNRRWSRPATVERCLDIEGRRGLCIETADGPVCATEGAAPCASGVCCRDGFTLPRGVRCEDEVIATETRCGPGRTSIETRSARRGCSGTSGACSLSSEHWTWTGWAPLETCDDDAVCGVGPDGDATCIPEPPACDAGACCNVGTGRVQPSTRGCGEIWRIEQTCHAYSVSTRDVEYLCDGLSPDCPRDRTRVRYDAWRAAYDCPGCRDTGSAIVCDEPGGGGGDPDVGACGAACLIDATCDNGNCEGGICAPAQCAACWATGSSCATGGGCSFEGCTDAGGGGGRCYGRDEVITLTDLSVAGVELDEMQVTARVSNYIGEPLVLINYVYAASIPGTRLGGSTRVWVAVRGPVGGTWYITQSIPVPDDRTPTENFVGGSPNWARLFCAGPGRETTCLDADTARAMVAEGLCFTTFLVAPSS